MGLPATPSPQLGLPATAAPCAERRACDAAPLIMACLARPGLERPPRVHPGLDGRIEVNAAASKRQAHGTRISEGRERQLGRESGSNAYHSVVTCVERDTAASM